MSHDTAERVAAFVADHGAPCHVVPRSCGRGWAVLVRTTWSEPALCRLVDRPTAPPYDLADWSRLTTLGAVGADWSAALSYRGARDLLGY